VFLHKDENDESRIQNTYIILQAFVHVSYNGMQPRNASNSKVEDKKTVRELNPSLTPTPVTNNNSVFHNLKRCMVFYLGWSSINCVSMFKATDLCE